MRLVLVLLLVEGNGNDDLFRRESSWVGLADGRSMGPLRMDGRKMSQQPNGKSTIQRLPSRSIRIRRRRIFDPIPLQPRIFLTSKDY